MKISNIEKLNRKYKITFENEKTIYLSENTIIKYNLTTRQEISVEKLKKITNSEYKEQAFSKGLNYLSYRMRTEYEIIEYLIKKEIPPEQIDYAIEKLKEYNYIDDKKYTELATKDYFELKKKGPLWIKNKLKSKGLNENYIENSISEICVYEKQIDNVYSIIEKEYFIKKEPKKKKIEKMTTKFYTNGYSFDIINNAFKIFFEENEDNSDNDIIIKHFEKANKKYRNKYSGYELKNKIISKLMRDGFSYDEIKDYFLEIDF